ncbi:MAG: FIST C-terminal domain-containing protein [Thermoleophilia bacterium]|nr:FIST C-terminal domain-containing protein [Thermoleophilia bacterium]
MTRVAAGLATASITAAAVADAAAQVSAGLAGRSADLAFLFLTPDHLTTAAEAAAAVHETLGPRHLLGCVAQGVIGRGRELESGPAVALWAASLPGAQLLPFHVAPTGDGDGEAPDGLPDIAGADLVTLLLDPFSLPATGLLDRLNADYPGVPAVGGIATGGGEPGSQALLLDGALEEGGAVGVALSGVSVRAVVSQGCAPLGPDSVITRAEGNVIFELAGMPALERLRGVIGGLLPDQRLLAARGLLAGLVIDENRPEYGRGDFLMRGILGADEESGAIAIAEQVRTGQTLRFHARDAESADRDLRLALDETLDTLPGRPAGALLFTCNGRGAGMFGGPDHDVDAVCAALGAPALAGFFCGGEIGPVGGRTFLHGFTATMAVFASDDPERW